MPTSNAYNAAEQLLKFTYGNNVVANFGYSSTRLQMTSLAYTNASSTLLLGLNYYYAHDSTNCATGVSGNNGQIQCINDVTSCPSP